MFRSQPGSRIPLPLPEDDHLDRTCSVSQIQMRRNAPALHRLQGLLLRIRSRAGWIPLLVSVFCLSALAVPVAAQSKRGFRYVGGTWDLKGRCRGQLQMGTHSVAFKCKERIFDLPFESLTYMEYRPAPSEKLRDTRVRWRRKPPLGVGVKVPFKKRKNKYFSVVFSKGGEMGVAVFRVKPRVMRPYLAELDLRSGMRVEMESFEP